MFSELVDEAVLETQRGVDKVQAASFVNSTIRECQMFKGAHFERDMIESTFVTATANPYIWTRPNRLRKLRTLQFDNSKVYPRFLAPGAKIGANTSYFYAAANYYAVFGAGDVATVNVAYFLYSRRFKYYSGLSGFERPAVYDFETETWTYATAYDTNATTRADGEALVSNWLLIDWWDLLKEGTVSKILKRAKDDKASVAFASYKSLQNDLLSGEIVSYMDAAQSGGSVE